jgi:excisionase family DNA binding protein|tara:strand:- start:269 stop:508 length:240 start_codon:yes stop_codon:yes gene_type:complete
MARQIGKLQEWLNMDQAAEYLGVTKRSVVNAIELVKSNQGNKELKIKRFGNRWLVSRTSLDNTSEIITRLAPHRMSGVQ